MNESIKNKPLTGYRLKILSIGAFLLILFFLSVAVCSAVLIKKIVENGFADTFKSEWPLLTALIIIEALIFWAGIIMVYTTSVQLGVKLRLVGVLCGWIPIVHLFVLFKIIKVTTAEAHFEKKKLKLNEKRKLQQICKTRYPILMVHGVFFRDFKYFNYWGRIPDELEKNGARVFYGNHQSAASVVNSAKELAARINEIVDSTGCGRVNIIAHSKGGLDIKTAVSCLGIADKVASIITVNTPHRGCEFAEYLLNKAPAGFKEKVANSYNSALRKLGDTDPDFIAAVTDLTASGCKKIWDMTAGFDFKGHGIYTKSIGSCMKQAGSGAFPLNMSYMFVKLFDGRNDGLVGEKSFPWGDEYIFLENKKKRGISHGDMIDLNRENIPGFDVRKFFIDIVADLKNKGL